MEISVYGIHHIVSRYLSLRRYVYVVSDYMVFFCSFLCCQCAEYAQESPAESVSDASLTPYQIVAQKVETDTKQAFGDPCQPLQLVVDIHHFDQVADEDDELKSTEILGLDNRRRDLDGTIATQDNNVESTSTELTHNPVPTKDPVANKRNEDYPIVHKKTQEPQSNKERPQNYSKMGKPVRVGTKDKKPAPGRGARNRPSLHTGFIMLSARVWLVKFC